MLSTKNISKKEKGDAPGVILKKPTSETERREREKEKKVKPDRNKETEL